MTRSAGVAVAAAGEDPSSLAMRSRVLAGNDAAAYGMRPRNVRDRSERGTGTA